MPDTLSRGMTETRRRRCSQWQRAVPVPCPYRAKYEGHMTEGNWQPVCGRHTRGFNWIVPLRAEEPHDA